MFDSCALQNEVLVNPNSPLHFTDPCKKKKKGQAKLEELSCAISQESENYIRDWLEDQTLRSLYVVSVVSPEQV